MCVFRPGLIAAILVASGIVGLWPTASNAQPAAAPLQERSSSTAPPGEKDKAQSLTPKWSLGDRWTVESAGRSLQARRGEVPLLKPIQWQFALSRFEKSLTRDCFRVEIRCLASDDGHPLTVLLVDRDSRTLRQVTTEIPVPGGFQQMTVSYDSDSGQPSPVLGPLTALPIDLPVFLEGRAKGLESFQYTASVGTPKRSPPPETQRKDLDDLAFAQDVEQRIAPLPADAARQLVSGAFAKSLESGWLAKSLSDETLTNRPITEVRLKSAGREIRQLWQPGNPWPIYCDNGYCVSRLVSHDGAPAKEQP